MKRYFLNTTWEAPQYFTAEPIGHQLYLERGEPAKEGMRWVEQYESAEECQQHADRWIGEEMDMGYVETKADDPAVATVAASVLAALPPLQLLPEKVRGQRIKLAHFTWYRLGSREEVARLLTQHGATVLDEQAAQDYGYTKALQENQKLFDFYSEYYQMAVELGDEADPLLHLGNNYGASFDDDKPVRLSDYLSLLLYTYGFKERERLLSHRLTPGGQLEAPAATALQGLATLDLTNPFHKDLDVPRSFASRDDDDYAPDDEADEALPAAAGDEAPAAAPIDLPVSEPLDSMAAGSPQVAFVAFESPFPITDSAHKAAFAVANPGRTPLTVLGYVAELVATAPGQEVVLGTDDSATHRDPLQGYTHVSNGMFLFFNASAGLCIEPLHLSAMPVLVPAGHRTTIHLYLHNLDLLAAGLGAAASYHLRVAVQLADSEVLRAQQPIAVSA